jgi:NodT family efflux transporter outer membrane factor (OMF) lipoprotein
VGNAQLTTDLSGWLSSIDDPVLQDLLQVGLSENLDIGTARARIEQARQAAGIAGAPYWPAANAQLSTQRARLPSGAGRSVTANSDEGAIAASWELDLFGATRNSVASAQALVENAAATAVGTRLLVTADILLDYADLRTAQNRVDIARRSAASQAQLLDLIRSRQAAGLATDADVAQVEATLSLTRATVPLLEAEIAQDVHALAILTARPPEALPQLGKTSPPIPTLAMVPLGVPAEAVRHRPDVIAAERQVAASYAQVGVARAALFPSLTLTGSAGRTGSSWTNLRAPEAFVWSAGAGLVQPLFAGGRLRAGVREARAVLEQQELQYRKTVLGAFGEVEDALSRMSADSERAKLLEAATTSATRARDRSKDLYGAGLGDLTAVLLAESTMLTSEDSLAQSMFNRFQDGVTLFKAMGGGWDGNVHAIASAGMAGFP